MKKEYIRPNDYEQRERPKTRGKQFFDIFKHRFLELLKLSLLQTIFSLPLLATIFLFWMLLQNSHSPQEAMTVFLIQGASFLISMPVAFVGLTGSFYAIKKLAYAEGEFASSAFFIGMKEEWARGLLIGVFAGSSAGIAVIGLYYFVFTSWDSNPTVQGLGIAIIIIQLILVMIFCYYSLAQVVVYKNTFRYLFKNSIIMELIRFPINLGLIILYPGGFIALICIMPYTMYVGLGLMILTCAFGHLVWMLNCISTFDKYINKEQYPDFYRKGLFKEETKEE